MMNNQKEINMHDPFVVRKAGMEALKERLGNAGAIRFIRLFSMGNGDYTKERSEWLDELTDEEVIAGMREIEESK